MPSRSRDAWLVAALLVVGVAVPAVVALAGGALLIPHNDDFAYRRAAQSWFETGEIRLTGWSVMTLVGQLAFTLPFQWLLGGSPWAFAAAGLALASIGLAAGYALARRLLAPAEAAFAVLLLVVTPGFLRNVPTFMTDIPALSAELLCLALGGVAVARTAEAGRWRWLAASLVAGAWAFSIREFAIAAPAAVLVAAFAGDARRRWGPYLLAGATLAIGCAVIYVTARSLPGSASTRLVPGVALDRVVDGVATLAFFVLPAMLVWVGRQLGS